MNELNRRVQEMTQEERDEMLADIIRNVFDLRQRHLNGDVLTPSEVFEMEELGRSIDEEVNKLGDAWLERHNLSRPAKKVVDGVFVEATCPRCKVFGIYDVERGVDSIIECKSCRGKMRIRLSKEN